MEWYYHKVCDALHVTHSSSTMSAEFHSVSYTV